MRSNGRANSDMRPISFTRHFTKHAEGSVLVAFGETKVLCNASVTDGVPRFLKGKNQGWVTGEYSLLPRATHTRTDREAARGKQSGRTLEIQRLIGRSLRAAVDLKALGENTITLDCDVIQADGGTRTAAISGACVALVDALAYLHQQGRIDKDNVLQRMIASVSVGIVDGTPMCDLDYREDSRADTDMNVVMCEHGKFIEIQGTAEQAAFSRSELDSMLELGESGAQQILQAQQAALEVNSA